MSNLIKFLTGFFQQWKGMMKVKDPPPHFEKLKNYLHDVCSLSVEGQVKFLFFF